MATVFIFPQHSHTRIGFALLVHIAPLRHRTIPLKRLVDVTAKLPTLKIGQTLQTYLVGGTFSLRTAKAYFPVRSRVLVLGFEGKGHQHDNCLMKRMPF